jgi:triosephosphate isomerase
MINRKQKNKEFGMRQKLIAGNWKMYKTIPEAVRLVTELRDKVEKNPPVKSKVAIFPPFTALAPVCEILSGGNIAVGAQNVFWEEEGAYTGEVGQNTSLSPTPSAAAILGRIPPPLIKRSKWL